MSLSSTMKSPLQAVYDLTTSRESDDPEGVLCFLLTLFTSIFKCTYFFRIKYFIFFDELAGVDSAISYSR